MNSTEAHRAVPKVKARTDHRLDIAVILLTLAAIGIVAFFRAV